MPGGAIEIVFGAGARARGRVRTRRGQLTAPHPAPYPPRARPAASTCSRLHDATAAERRAVAWTAVAFFCVLFAYYLLRPLRENVGYAFGTDHLIWLFASPSC